MLNTLAVPAERAYGLPPAPSLQGGGHRHLAPTEESLAQVLLELAREALGVGTPPIVHFVSLRTGSRDSASEQQVKATIAYRTGVFVAPLPEGLRAPDSLPPALGCFRDEGKALIESGRRTHPEPRSRAGVGPGGTGAMGAALGETDDTGSTIHALYSGNPMLCTVVCEATSTFFRLSIVQVPSLRTELLLTVCHVFSQIPLSPESLPRADNILLPEELEVGGHSWNLRQLSLGEGRGGLQDLVVGIARDDERTASLPDSALFGVFSKPHPGEELVVASPQIGYMCTRISAVVYHEGKFEDLPQVLLKFAMRAFQLTMSESDRDPRTSYAWVTCSSMTDGLSGALLVDKEDRRAIVSCVTTTISQGPNTMCMLITNPMTPKALLNFNETMAALIKEVRHSVMHNLYSGGSPYVIQGSATAALSSQKSRRGIPFAVQDVLDLCDAIISCPTRQAVFSTIRALLEMLAVNVYMLIGEGSHPFEHDKRVLVVGDMLTSSEANRVYVGTPDKLIAVMVHLQNRGICPRPMLMLHDEGHGIERREPADKALNLAVWRVFGRKRMLVGIITITGTPLGATVREALDVTRPRIKAILHSDASSTEKAPAGAGCPSLPKWELVTRGMPNSADGRRFLIIHRSPASAKIIAASLAEYLRRNRPLKHLEVVESDWSSELDASVISERLDDLACKRAYFVMGASLVAGASTNPRAEVVILFNQSGGAEYVIQIGHNGEELLVMDLRVRGMDFADLLQRIGRAGRFDRERDPLVLVIGNEAVDLSPNATIPPPSESVKNTYEIEARILALEGYTELSPPIQNTLLPPLSEAMKRAGSCSNVWKLAYRNWQVLSSERGTGTYIDTIVREWVLLALVLSPVTEERLPEVVEKAAVVALAHRDSAQASAFLTALNSSCSTAASNHGGSPTYRYILQADYGKKAGYFRTNSTVQIDFGVLGNVAAALAGIVQFELPPEFAREQDMAWGEIMAVRRNEGLADSDVTSNTLDRAGWVGLTAWVTNAIHTGRVLGNRPRQLEARRPRPAQAGGQRGPTGTAARALGRVAGAVAGAAFSRAPASGPPLRDQARAKPRAQPDQLGRGGRQRGVRRAGSVPPSPEEVDMWAVPAQSFATSQPQPLANIQDYDPWTSDPGPP